MKIRYIGPFKEGVEIDITPQRLGIPTFVAHNHQVEVPDELAGREPKGDDPGEGFLAQTDNWVRVESKEAKS